MIARDEEDQADMEAELTNYDLTEEEITDEELDVSPQPIGITFTIINEEDRPQPKKSQSSPPSPVYPSSPL